MSTLALRTSLHSFHNSARPHLNYSSPLFRHATIRRSFTLPARLHGLKPYFELARLDKPIGTWLLYLPCTWGISMACYSSHAPPSVWLGNLALFGFGAVIMRGAGCTINDMWDSGIDAKVARTKGRPLAAGQLSYQKAWSFLALQLSGGLAVLSQLNTYSIALGASSLAIVAVYPLMKRITYWPQLVLGFAFNWGALLGSSAVLGTCDWAVALPLYFSGVAWTIFYDTIYAHQDKTDDLSSGVKSTALLFAERSPQILSFFGGSFVSLLALAGYMNGQGLPFYLISVLGSAAHLTWQMRTVKWNEPSSCWKKFGSNRDLGLLVFGGLGFDYLLSIL